MDQQDYKNLLEYCVTDTQRQVITALAALPNITQVAKKLGRNRRSIQRVLDRVKNQAMRRNFAPEFNQDHPVAPGAFWGGSTQLYVHELDENGEGKRLDWVRSVPDKAKEYERIMEALENLALEQTPRPKVKHIGTKLLSDDFFSVVPIGDPHIGLLCWAQEVGVDWDIPIALRVYQKVYERLFTSAPNTEECVLINTGDLFHADNIIGETSRGHNRLELDGRPGKWIEAAIALMEMLLTACLQKYRRVHYINVPGNHDDILGLMMGVFIDHFYQFTGRLTVQRGTNPFQYYERGRVLLGTAHGHTCLLKNLPGKMALDQREAWGRTILHHWITGHVHHKQMLQYKEHPGCSVESVGILPPADSFAHGLGLGSQRDAQILIFNSKRGMLQRRIFEQVEAED